MSTGSVAPRHVLIVDDEHNIADTLALIFTNNGYETRTAYSAEQALILTQDWTVDLAIVDVILPQMHGLDLALLLTELYPACRVLLFSGQPSAGELAERPVYKKHAFQILAKPIHPVVLLAEATAVLENSSHP